MSLVTLAIVTLIAALAVVVGPKRDFDGALVQISALAVVTLTAGIYVLDLLVRSII